MQRVARRPRCHRTFPSAQEGHWSTHVASIVALLFGTQVLSLVQPRLALAQFFFSLPLHFSFLVRGGLAVVSPAGLLPAGVNTGLVRSTLVGGALVVRP